MASLLEKMATRRDAKAFEQPPFWEQDGLTAPYWYTSATSNAEKIDSNYLAYVESAFKASGPVFSVIRFRQAIFSEARFQWREYRAGVPGDLFGTADLALLERPWRGGTTGSLLARMEVTASLAGNYYCTVCDDQGRLGRQARGIRRIVHMQPDRVTIVIDAPSGDPNGLDAQIVGFEYTPPPSGRPGPADPVLLLPQEVCHYAPIPDPEARFRGMSWLTPVIEEIRADKAAVRHKGKFFQNGAHPSMSVTLPETVSPDKFKEYVAAFKLAHQGVDRAYSPLFLAGGADVRPLSADFRAMDFTGMQGKAETRIAMAAGVHPTIVGMSEGLQGSSLNSGNFNAAARLAANTTMRPLWREAAASLETLVPPPSSTAVLTYDDREIAFLREDATDRSDIRQKNAAALRTLIDGGMEPDAAIDYLLTDDLKRMKGRHTGLLPVQLQPPGSGEIPPRGPEPPVLTGAP